MIFGAIIQLIIIILLLILLYYIYRPIPLRSLYEKYLVAVSNHDESMVSVIGEHVLYNTVYQIKKISNKSNKLVVWFHGGGFIKEKAVNIIPFLVYLSEQCNVDVLTFDYPLPYKCRLDDTLVYISQILNKFFSENSKYDYIYFGGDSAGAYLALKILELQYNEAFRMYLNVEPVHADVTAFIGVCGFYDPTFGNKPLALPLFNSWFWNVRNITFYKTCNVRCPSLIISSTQDFLVFQSRRFVDRQPRNLVTFRQFTTPNTIHCFISNTKLPETIEATSDMCEFINRVVG